MTRGMPMKLGRTFVSLWWTVVVVAILVLTWIGLERTYPDIASARYLPDRVFRMIKTLMGNDPLGGSLEAQELAWQLIAAKLLVCVLLVRSLMKLVGSVFHQHVQTMRVWLKPHPTLIVGAGRKGRALAHDLKAQHDETAVVIERQAGAATPDLQDEGHVVLNGDVTAGDVLRSAGALKARRVICFAQDQQLGIQVAGRLRELWRNHDRATAPCDCHIHLDNPRLVDLLRDQTARNSAVHLHFFNLHKMVARGLFDSLPPVLAPMLTGARQLQVELIGFGPEAQAILVQGLRVLHFGLPQGVSWRVWTDAPQHAEEAFNASHPMATHIAPIAFHASDMQYRAMISELLAAEPDTAHLILCAQGQDERDLTAAAEVLQALPDTGFPVYARCADARGLPALLDAQSRLHLFGDLNAYCTVEMICGERQDRLARAIHADYLGLTQGTASESARYKAAWDELHEEARDANRAQADHLAYKLMLSGGSAGPHSAELLEQLARVEHERWAAHRYLQGWQYGPARDDVRKRHPSLVPWEALSEGERDKDRDAVRRLPDLLALQG